MIGYEHARIVSTAPGRTWCGSPGRRVIVENRTLCGAEPGLDVRLRGDRSLPRRDHAYLRCVACRTMLEIKTPLAAELSPLGV
jgi:hypothetical protein